MKKLFAILFVALFVFTACNNNTNKTVGDKDMPTIREIVKNAKASGKVEVKDLEVRIFQTLNQHSALAFSDGFSTVMIVSEEDTYYDDKKITGKFVLIGTYSYQNKEGDTKTVPLYIRYSEYQKNN